MTGLLVPGSDTTSTRVAASRFRDGTAGRRRPVKSMSHLDKHDALARAHKDRMLAVGRPMSAPARKGIRRAMDEASTGARGDGRRGREARRAARATARAVYTPYITRKIPLTEFLTEEGLQIIENNAETVLAEIGIEFKDYPRALALLKDAGCDVDGERVRFPRGLARKLCSTVPARYTQHARNPSRSVEIGGPHTVFAPVYGSPFVHDLDRGRRYGTIEDFRNFVKLAYLSPHLHHSGGTVCEPVDLPVNKRHLEMVYAHLKLSDKPFMGSVTAPSRAADTVALAEIVFGREFVAENTVVTSLINANSPMVWDSVMLGAAEAYAAANQACIITPFILSGAMSPVTVVGTLTQVLAEVMAGTAFTQLVRPGAPVIFGTFVSTLSMQSGAPTFGTPEAAKAIYGAAQLARRMNMPFRTGGSLCASKVPDAQAAYESAQTLVPTVHAGTNFVLHAAGWLEGGLASSYEKFVMDADQLGAMAVLARGIEIDENQQAMDALREVGPGKHFLGCAHTQANFETAFYRHELADNNSVEQWTAEGSRDMPTRANALWKKMLAEYEPPELDPGIDEALRDYIDRKKASLPDETV
jgi:trimethylamine--corrinoid protein Co-methyltransferase